MCKVSLQPWNLTPFLKTFKLFKLDMCSLKNEVTCTDRWPSSIPHYKDVSGSQRSDAKSHLHALPIFQSLDVWISLMFISVEFVWKRCIKCHGKPNFAQVIASQESWLTDEADASYRWTVTQYCFAHRILPFYPFALSIESQWHFS